MGRGGGEQYDTTAPVTGATGVTREQVESAILGLMDAWNSPKNINPRTRQRYKHPWSEGLWFRFMGPALEAVVPPGMVIAPRGDVLTAEGKAAIKRAATYMESDTDPYGSNIDLWESDIALFRAIANGGQS